MNQEQAIAYQSGRIAAVVCLGILSLIFLVRGVQSTQKSARFSNLALFAGLLAFFRPEILFDVATIEPVILYSIGIVRTLAGVAGIVFAVIGLKARDDGGAGAIRPVLGLLFSLLHCLTGVAAFVLPAMIPGDRSPWPHQIQGTSVSFDLPSSDWKSSVQTQFKTAEQFLRGGVYPAKLLVFSTEAAEQVEFDAVATKNDGLMANGPGVVGPPERLSGNTRGGAPYRIIHVQAKDPSTREFNVCMASVWITSRKTAVTFLMESPRKYASETATGMESKWFKEQIRKIVESTR